MKDESRPITPTWPTGGHSPMPAVIPRSTVRARAFCIALWRRDDLQAEVFDQSCGGLSCLLDVLADIAAEFAMQTLAHAADVVNGGLFSVRFHKQALPQPSPG